MSIEDHLKRARGLLQNGRFQRKVVKELPAFPKIEAQGHWVEEIFFEPYFDENSQQIVFLAPDALTQSPYTLLVFSKRDYGFGSEGSFVWADHDEAWS
jgi:hypothetical protein